MRAIQGHKTTAMIINVGLNDVSVPELVSKCIIIYKTHVYVVNVISK